jgi:hypothetical protein
MFSFLLLSRQSYTVSFTLLGRREHGGIGSGSIIGGQTTDGVLGPSHQGLDLTLRQSMAVHPPLVELTLKVLDDFAVLHISPQHQWSRRGVDVWAGYFRYVSCRARNVTACGHSIPFPTRTTVTDQYAGFSAASDTVSVPEMAEVCFR